MSAKKPKPSLSRPLRWWTQHRKLWHPSWHESEVPEGEKLRDPKTGEWRAPYRYEECQT